MTMDYVRLTKDSYLCCKCGKAHRKSSKIGKEHIKYKCIPHDFSYAYMGTKIRYM